MSTTKQRAIYSTLFGIVFYALFYDHLPGVSLLLGTTAFLAVLMVSLPKEKTVQAKALALMLFMLGFSLSSMFLAAPELLILNILALLCLALLLTSELGFRPWSTWQVKDYLPRPLATLAGIARSGLQGVAELTVPTSKNPKSSDTKSAIAKGLLLALPIVLVFTLLFRSANPYLANALDNIFILQLSPDLLGGLLVILLASLTMLGVVIYIQAPQDNSNIAEAEPKQQANIEGVAFISLLALAFLVFLGFQLGYLFSGSSQASPASLTYAEYLHKGFAETIISALLTTLVLLGVEKFYGKLQGSHWLYRVSTYLVLVSSAIITLSTLYRMYIYQAAYGLSIQRMLVGVFSLWVLSLLIILGLKLQKHLPETFFMTTSIFTALVLWSLYLILNPHAYIAKTNFNRYHKGLKLDTYYLTQLSSDAVPTLTQNMDKLTAEDKSIVYSFLQDQKSIANSFSDWQSWNLSRSRAGKFLHYIELPAPIQDLQTP